MQAQHTSPTPQSSISEREWAITINNQDDARRYARLAGWVGFVYVVLTTLIFLFGMKQGIAKMAGQDALAHKQLVGLTMGMMMVGLRFLLYSLLSFMSFIAKGIPSIGAGILMLTFFVLELCGAAFMVVSKAMFMGIIVVAPVAILGYIFYAGIVGNWQNRKFINELRNC